MKYFNKYMDTFDGVWNINNIETHTISHSIIAIYIVKEANNTKPNM